MNTFILLSLVTWRMASLVANENGAFHMFKRFRDWCKSMCERSKFCQELHLDELVGCEWCNSVWLGAGWTGLLFLYGNVQMSMVLWLAYPFALSAVTVIIKYAIQVLRSADELLFALHKSRRSGLVPAQHNQARETRVPFE